MAVLLILKAFAVSFVTLGEQMLPSAPQDLPNHPDSEVRIYAAAFDNVAWQDSFGVPSGYATAPAFAAFNKAGNVIGVANTDWNADNDLEILNGDFREYTIQQTAGPFEPVEYLQIYATGTPICIAGVSMRWADGVGSAFSGDFGRSCGAAWYFSNVNFGDGDYQPDCVWLDSGIRDFRYDVGEECLKQKAYCKEYNIKKDDCDCNKYDKTPRTQFPSGLRFLPKALQYTVSKFGLRPLLTTDPEAYCAEEYLTFRHRLNAYGPPGPGIDYTYFDTNSVTLFEQGSDLNEMSPETRDTSFPQNNNNSSSSSSSTLASSPSPPPYNFYISTSLPAHSAIQLCSSVTSLGPDLYSEAERKFCDMAPGGGLKRVYDACSVPVEEAARPCWDVEGHRILRVGGRREKRGRTGYRYQVGWKEGGKVAVMDLFGGVLLDVAGGLLANGTLG